MSDWKLPLSLLVILVAPNAFAQTDLTGAVPVATAPQPLQGQVPGQTVPSSPGYIRLHIDTDTRNVQLRRVVFEDTTIAAPYIKYTLLSDVICRAPCDGVVDGRLGNEYYFGGSGVTSSGRFTLLDYQGSVKARVSAGSQGLRTASKVFFWVGVGLAAPGSAIFMATANAPADTSGDGMRTFHTISTGMLLGGAVSLISGITMYFSSRTSYEFDQVN
jgi:hypothetical protein